MSSEVCPFCGKSYKRLKRHLPHCKAAASSKTPPTEGHDKTNQTTSSSPQVAGSSEPTAKGRKSTQATSKAASPQSKNRAKGPPQSSSPAEPFNNVNSSSSSQSSTLSPPPSTKMKKQKLSEQTKMASSPTPSPAVSNKKSLHALIEAAKSDQVTEGSLEGARPASEDPSSGPVLFLTDPVRSRTTAQMESHIIPDDASFSPPSTDIKPKDAPRKNVSRIKKTVQSLPTTKDIDPDALDSEMNETSIRPRAKDNLWVDNKEDIEDLSVNKMFLRSGGGHQARVTIHGVKATLGRAKTTRQSSILSQVDNLNSKTRLGTSLSPVTAPAENQKDAVSSLVAAKTRSDQLPSASSQHTGPQSVKIKSSKSKPLSLIPLQHDGPSQPKLTSPPATHLLPGHLSYQLSQATPPPLTASTNEGPKLGHRMPGLPSVFPSPVQFSGLNRFPIAPQTLLGRVGADDWEKLEDGRQNAACNRTEGVVAARRLGQVTLRELPEWLACKTPSHPRDVVQMVQRGWQWYYRKYIDVKKGGVGGLSMLLAGYCVLSYIWSYPHIKRDRWRKYH